MNRAGESRISVSPFVRFVAASAFALAVFVSPAYAHASSALVWDGLPMQNGGTYEVPFNENNFAQVISDSPLADFGAEGVLFFVPDPDLPNRQFVSNVGGPFGPFQLTWTQAGIYEVDVYGTDFGLSKTDTVDRFLGLLFGHPAHAAVTPLFIETIRFTVQSSDEPPAYAECCSSVIFLPGIEGSQLILVEVLPLWPPLVPSSLFDTLNGLAINDEGESENPIFVDGIVNTFYGTPIYSGFSSFMDDLVANEDDDINLVEWKAFPYDWRFSPDRVVADNDMVSEVESFADFEHSPTGKVTIVAHSYGGLVGKALIKELEAQGKADLIDSFVMVGTPQLGTPQAIASLLHGDDQVIPSGISLGGFILNPVHIVNAETARQVALNFESAYDLLPSTQYFEEVLEPVITFDPDASFTDPWRTEWGDEGITNFLDFFAFLTGGGVAREDPSPTELKKPEILDPDLLTSAADFHSEFDSYDFPENIRVVEVAGWGIPTTKAVNYQNTHFLGLPTPFQGYATVPNREGDKTVLYPSAIASDDGDAEKYFFNLDLFRDPDDKQAQHRNLLNTPPLQNLVLSIIEKDSISETEFVSIEKPNLADLDDQLVVSTHSPVLLRARDGSGNVTGVNPLQDLSSDYLFTSEDVPGSVFVTSGGDQYIFLPKTGSYTFEFEGIGEGPATVQTGVFTGNTVIPAATYSDIPVTSTTLASFEIDSTAPGDAVIEVNQDGEEILVPPDPSLETFEGLLAELKAAVQNLTDTKIKNNFLKRIEKLQQKIEKQKTKKSNTLQNLENQIAKKSTKGKIDGASAGEIIVLIDELQAQVGTFPLDPSLIAELRTKVESLLIPQALKNSLLKKVERLEKLAGISNSLSRFIGAVSRKADKGKLLPNEVATLNDLLTQLENAL